MQNFTKSSAEKVLLSLWDETANLQVENNQILAVKSAKVVRFFGISLKNGPGTDIRVSLRVNHSKLISLIKLGLN